MVGLQNCLSSVVLEGDGMLYVYVCMANCACLMVTDACTCMCVCVCFMCVYVYVCMYIVCVSKYVCVCVRVHVECGVCREGMVSMHREALCSLIGYGLELLIFYHIIHFTSSYHHASMYQPVHIVC